MVYNIGIDDLTDEQLEEYNRYRWRWVNRNSDMHDFVLSIIEYSVDEIEEDIQGIIIDDMVYGFMHSREFNMYKYDDMDAFLNAMVDYINEYLDTEYVPEEFLNDWENDCGILGNIWDSPAEFLDSY